MTIRTAIRLALPAALALSLIASGTATAAAAGRPSAPQSVAAKPGNAFVRVSWAAPSSTGGSPINRYAVQRALSATGTWNTVKKVSATTFAWKNTGLTNGTRYYYRVRAHNTAGSGPASTVVSAVPRTVPSAPRSPTATPGDTTVDLSWAAPASDGGAPIDAYRAQLSTDGTYWSNVSAAMQTQLTATGLQNGIDYRFRIRAHNAAGWSPASTEVQAIPGTPLPPTQLQAQSVSDGVELSWTASATASPAVTGYELQWSETGAIWNVLTPVSAGTTTHYRFKYPLGVTYYFRLRAQNFWGYSEYTAVVSAVAGLVPSAVGNLAVTYYGSPLFANSVGWSAPTSGSPVQGYYVDRIVTEGPYVRVANLTASAYPSYYDSGVTHFTDYWYRITPYNQVGDGPSSVVHFTTP